MLVTIHMCMFSSGRNSETLLGINKDRMYTVQLYPKSLYVGVKEKRFLLLPTPYA